MEDENSILHYYKKLIELRKQERAFVYGDFKPILEDDSDIVAYYRTYGKDKFLVVCNFFGRDRIIEASDMINSTDDTNVKIDVILSNYADCEKNPTKLHLRPYEAVIYRIDSIVQ